MPNKKYKNGTKTELDTYFKKFCVQVASLVVELSSIWYLRKLKNRKISKFDTDSLLSARSHFRNDTLAIRLKNYTKLDIDVFWSCRNISALIPNIFSAVVTNQFLLIYLSHYRSFPIRCYLLSISLKKTVVCLNAN